MSSKLMENDFQRKILYLDETMLRVQNKVIFSMQKS